MAEGVPSFISRVAARLAAHRPRVETDPALIWAAVAVILVPEPDALLLIRRAERAGDPWSGHMALPGGRQAADDPTLLDAAIRESAEEIGVALKHAQCIGALDDVAPRTPVLPPIAVRPYVFALPERPGIVPNLEVAAAHWISVEELRRPNTRRPAQMDIRGRLYHVEAYDVAGTLVWGMTERILSSLLRCFVDP